MKFVLASLAIEHGGLLFLALALVVSKGGLAQGVLVSKLQQVPALVAEGSLVVAPWTTFATEDGSMGLFLQAQQVSALALVVSKGGLAQGVFVSIPQQVPALITEGSLVVAPWTTFATEDGSMGLFLQAQQVSALALVVSKGGLAQGVFVSILQQVPALVAEGSLVVAPWTTFATEDGSMGLFLQAQQVSALALVVSKGGLAQGVLVSIPQQVPALITEGSLVVAPWTTFATEDGSMGLFLQAQQVSALALVVSKGGLAQGVLVSILQQVPALVAEGSLVVAAWTTFATEDGSMGLFL